MAIVVCACGCGELRPQIDRYDNKRKYINGHNRKGSRHTAEAKKKVSEARLKRREELGYINSLETKQKISETLSGRTLSMETRQRMSEDHKGQIGWNKGGQLSEETIMKMVESRRGYRHSEETKEKISIALSGKYVGSLASNWQGGVSFEPYDPKFNRQLKKIIHAKDGYCMYPECGTIDDLCVHHIDYDKMNSEQSNLIVLCRSHNNKVNNEKDYWKKYFQMVLVIGEDGNVKS